MSSHKSNIISMVLGSPLPSDQKKELLAFLHFIGDDHLKEVEELFRLHPNTIDDFYRNVKTKTEAVREGDDERLQEILQREKEVLLALDEAE